MPSRAGSETRRAGGTFERDDAGAVLIFEPQRLALALALLQIN